MRFAKVLLGYNLRRRGRLMQLLLTLVGIALALFSPEFGALGWWFAGAFALRLTANVFLLAYWAFRAETHKFSDKLDNWWEMLWVKDRTLAQFSQEVLDHENRPVDNQIARRLIEAEQARVRKEELQTHRRLLSDGLGAFGVRDFFTPETLDRLVENGQDQQFLDAVMRVPERIYEAGKLRFFDGKQLVECLLHKDWLALDRLFVNAHLAGDLYQEARTFGVGWEIEKLIKEHGLAVARQRLADIKAERNGRKNGTVG